jgi:hypothetical protein
MVGDSTSSQTVSENQRHRQGKAHDNNADLNLFLSAFLHMRISKITMLSDSAVRLLPIRPSVKCDLAGWEGADFNGTAELTEHMAGFAHLDSVQ